MAEKGRKTAPPPVWRREGPLGLARWAGGVAARLLEWPRPLPRAQPRPHGSEPRPPWGHSPPLDSRPSPTTRRGFRFDSEIHNELTVTRSRCLKRPPRGLIAVGSGHGPSPRGSSGSPWPLQRDALCKLLTRVGGEGGGAALRGEAAARWPHGLCPRPAPRCSGCALAGEPARRSPAADANTLRLTACDFFRAEASRAAFNPSHSQGSGRRHTRSPARSVTGAGLCTETPAGISRLGRMAKAPGPLRPVPAPG